uniref:Uncharacterized protein n=1 Tax=Timema bartmani TaxID=61472 RepID=A0A7R9F846_9NEOP|nr:unnamed protein product [Timema bartmani]
MLVLPHMALLTDIAEREVVAASGCRKVPILRPGPRERNRSFLKVGYPVIVIPKALLLRYYNRRTFTQELKAVVSNNRPRKAVLDARVVNGGAKSLCAGLNGRGREERDNHGHQSLEITPPQQPGHIGRMHVQKVDNLSHIYHPTPTIVEAPITSANAPRTPDVHFSFRGLSFPVTGSSFLDGSPHHSRSIVRAPIGKGDLLTPYKIQSDGGHLSYANERSVQPLYQPQSDYFPLFNTSRPKQQPHKKQDYWNEMSQHEYRLQGQTIPHTSKLDDHLYDGMNFTTNTCKSAQKKDQDRGNNQNQMENSRYLPGYYVDLAGTNPITYIRPAPTNNVNTVTSMHTSCVEQQPSDNVRMFMDIESRGLLQCDTDAKDTRKEESNNMQRNVSHLSNVCQSKLPVSIEMNNNLKSDSTFSIECQVMGERMVSALCTTPVKDKEEGLDFQNEKDLHVKNWLNNISFDGMSPNTDASYIMDVKEEDCVSDSSTVCVPVLIRNRDLTKRYLIPHSFSSRSDWSCETASPMFKNNDAVQSTKRTYCNAKKSERISPTSGTQSNETVIDFENNNYLYYVENFCSYLNESVPKLYPQRTVVAYDEDAVMVPMHVGTIPPQSDGLYNNSLSVVEDSTPAMSKITYMDLQPSPKPDLRTELVDDDLDGNYIQKGTYNPPSKSSMSKSTSVLTSKSSNCASVPDSFNSVQETNPSENVVRLRKDYHSPDANTIHFSMYNMYNTTKNVSDTTWKKAVAKVDTMKDPIETLVKSLQRESLNDSQDKEASKINKEYKVDQDQSLEKKSSSSNDVSPEEKRKCEPIKTDNWLIKTLANASKLHGDSCLKNSEKLYGSQIINSSNTKGDTVEEESQILESDLTCNEMIPADSRVLVMPIESTSSGRKVSREKKKNITNKQGEETLVWTPVEKRGLCGARKRRFRDRAAERMVAEIDEEDDSRTAVVGKGYARGKERWGIWCSSRRRRGLSKMARDKLEAILNMIWNMEEAEFIKYAVDSTSVSTISS